MIGFRIKISAFSHHKFGVNLTPKHKDLPNLFFFHSKRQIKIAIKLHNLLSNNLTSCIHLFQFFSICQAKNMNK